jgi:hypothetical protein
VTGARNLARLAEETFERRGDYPALWFEGAWHSSGELFARAERLAAGLVEHASAWPLLTLVDDHHPARGDLPALWGNRRALLQATWRHALFGAVLGALEALINDRSEDEPPMIPFSSNGHGSLETAVSVSEA